MRGSFSFGFPNRGEGTVVKKSLSPLLVLFLASALGSAPLRAQTATATPATPPAAPSTGGPMPSAQGATVYFINIKNGDKLPRTFTVQFGLRNMGLAPAGADRPNSGHHHLLIDTDLPPMNEPIPNDFNHLHFGLGQSEAKVTLTPGEHTLQLLFADKNHVPHTPPVLSERIKVTVLDQTAPQASAPAKESAPKAAPKRRAQPMPSHGETVTTIPQPARYRWCAMYRNGGVNCGFVTLEQCQAAISGAGGSCRPN
jgi:hypothetical protein